MQLSCGPVNHKTFKIQALISLRIEEADLKVWKTESVNV